MNKQIVYLPAKVEEGLDSAFATNGKGERLIYVTQDLISKDSYLHWLKPTEGYFFTTEELKQLLSDAFDKGRDYQRDFGVINSKETFIENFF